METLFIFTVAIVLVLVSLAGMAGIVLLIDECMLWLHSNWLWRAKKWHRDHKK